MEKMMILLLTAVFGYFIGSVSFARIIFARLKPGEEPNRLRTPTKDGQAELVSHAIGSTNVMVAFGSRWGLFTTVLDVAKTFVPTLALRLVFPNESYHLVCAAAVLVGHLWPVWYKFSGGGGNSCVLGMLLAISPVGMLVTHIGGLLIGEIIPVLAFLGGVALTIPWFAMRNGIFSPETAFAITITGLYVAGQLPEAMMVLKLKRDGHVLDTRHVLRMMKHSAATGRSGEDRSGGRINEGAAIVKNENRKSDGGSAGR
jgi:acyl phosphate:glycerol-3-phosphate acyltransferase